MPDEKPTKEENGPKEESITVSLQWPTKSDVPLLHANYFAVLKTANEAVLTFGEFLPYIQHPEERKTQEFLESANISVVARIAMSPAGFNALVGMMSGLEKKEQPDDNP